MEGVLEIIATHSARGKIRTDVGAIGAHDTGQTVVAAKNDHATTQEISPNPLADLDVRRKREREGLAVKPVIALHGHPIRATSPDSLGWLGVEFPTFDSGFDD